MALTLYTMTMTSEEYWEGLVVPYLRGEWSVPDNESGRIILRQIEDLSPEMRASLLRLTPSA